MIEVSAAVQLIRQAAKLLNAESVLLANAVGRILAEPVIADLDAPPFDKSMMDGFAISSADFAAGRRTFPIVDCVVAGQADPSGVLSGTAVHIMTGAPIPNGADAIVMLEETSAAPLPSPLRRGEGKEVTIRTEQVRAGQHLMKRGSIYRCGDCLLPAGHRISAHDVGLLAEAGASQLLVRRTPVVGVIATGNEICSPDQKPEIGQIRNSNGPLLLAMVTAQKALALDLGTARDDERSLSDAMRRGLEADILVLTGGVSAGMLDLVPRVLKSLGVRQIFHKISLKPGKPVWFGVKDDRSQPCLVFGLPGNPVSAFVCFHLLVKEALAVINGQQIVANAPQAILDRAHEIRGDRPTYWPSRLSLIDGRAVVAPLPWQGSADQRCLTQANCLAIFPVGDQTYPEGTLVEIREL